MRKSIIGVLVLSLGIGVIYLQQKQVLPIPDYPLSVETVAEALESKGLNCTVEEDLLNFPEETMYNVHNVEDGKFVVAVRSIQKEGE